MTPELDHLVIEIVAFTGALADAGEYRIAAVRLGDIVDQFHDQHGLADASAAKQSDLSPFGVGREQIDHLDAGDQDCGFGRLIGIGRRGLMDRAPLFRLDRTRFIHGIADHVDDASEQTRADRHRNRRAGVPHFLTAHQPFADVHRHGAHGIFAELLRYFEHQPIALV